MRRSGLVLFTIPIICLSFLWAVGGDAVVPSGVAAGAHYFHSCYNECRPWPQQINVRVHVIDSTRGVSGAPSYRGTFAIGSEDTSKSLMYNYPRTWEVGGAASQNVVLNIDGDCYSQHQRPPFMGYSVPPARNLRNFYVSTQIIPYSALDEPETSIVTRWTIPLTEGNIELYQYMTPVKVAVADTFVGQIQTQYVVINSTPIVHNIGVALLMDLKVQSNDRPKLAVGPTFIDRCILQYAPVPSYWQAWEDPANPNAIVARGICRGSGATPPSLIALGDYLDLSGKAWIPPGTPYNSVYTDSFYSNSAAFIEWFQVPINPGSQASFVTYYGFGRPGGAADSLCAEIFTEGTVTADSCRILDTILASALITNTNALGIDANSVIACLAVPSPLQVWDPATGMGADSVCTTFSIIQIDSSRLVTWRVYIPPHTAWNDTFTMRYWTRSSEFPWCLRSANLIVDTMSGIPPTFSWVDSTWFSFVNCRPGCVPSSTNPRVSLRPWFWIHDDEGINREDILVTINTTASREFDSLIHDDEHLPDTFAILIPDSLCVHGDSIRILVAPMQDIKGCMSLAGLYTVMVVDTAPPYFTVTSPAPNSIMNCATTPVISFSIYDSLAGVTTQHLQFRVHTTTLRYGSTGVSYTASADSHSATVSYTSPTPYPSETWVQVCIDSIADKVRLCSPNYYAPSPPYCWRFMCDNTAPRIRLVHPDTNLYVSCDTLRVCFTFNDSNYVDTTAVVIRVEEMSFYWSNLYVNRDTACLNIPLGSFSSCETLRVNVQHFPDTLGNDLVTPGTTWRFFLDFNSPYVSQVFPPNGALIGRPRRNVPICSLLVSDDCSRINVGSAVFTASRNGGSPVTIPNSHFHYDAVTSWFIIDSLPSSLPVADGDSLRICLDYLTDNAVTCGANAMTTSYCWQYRVDGRGPSVQMVYPRPNSHTSCGSGYLPQRLCLTIHDSLSSVNTSSFNITVNGTVISSFFFTPPDTYCTSITFPFGGSCEPVNVQIHSVRDSLGNMTPDSGVIFTFISDTLGPYITDILPSHGSSRPTAVCTLVFEDDCSPVWRDSTCIKVWSIPSHPLFVYACGNATGLTWIPASTPSLVETLIVDARNLGAGGENGDTVHICVYKSFDTLDYFDCGFNDGPDSCWWFRVSTGGPTISLISPPNRSFLSCSTFCAKYRVRDVDGIDTNSITVSYSINGSPWTNVNWPSPSITYAGTPSDTLADTITFCLPDGVTLSNGDSVALEFTHIEDAMGQPNDDIPISWFRIDRGAPQILGYWPGMGEIISTTSPRIWVLFSDTASGILDTSLVFRLGTREFRYDDTCVYWRGDTAFFDISTHLCDTSFRGGDNISVCVSVSDSVWLGFLPSCPPNTVSNCWFFSVASEGPTASAIIPQCNWIVSCNTLDSLAFVIRDDDGVDLTTLRINVRPPSGTPQTFTYPSGITVRSDTLFIVRPVPPLTEEGTYRISVQALDSLGNAMADDSFSCSFIVDRTPPQAIDFFIPGFGPLCGESTITDVTPLIGISLFDSLGRPHLDSLCLIISHSSIVDTICLDDPALWITGSLPTQTLWVSFDSLGYILEGGESVTIWAWRFCGYSNMCAPTCQSGDSCSFSIASGGPIITNISPGPQVTLGCLMPFYFLFRLNDPDGIDSSSVRVVVCCDISGECDTIVPGAPPLGSGTTLRNDTLSWQMVDPIVEACAECETMWISIIAKDNLNNDQFPNQFWALIDRTPPGIEMVSPTPFADILTTRPSFVIRFPDNCVGVDTSRVCVRIHWSTGDTVFCDADAGVIWSADTMKLPQLRVPSYDTVWLCIDTIWDAVDTCVNVNSNDTCMWFFVAQRGPVATLIYPDTSLLGDYICANDSFVIRFSDREGVVQESVHIEINGSPIVSPYIHWRDESTLVVTPDTLDSSVITVLVWGHTDVLGYVGDSTSFTFLLDNAPPTAIWLGALPPDFLPTIIIRLSDSEHSIIPATCTLTVDGVPYVITPGILDWFPARDSLVFYADSANDTFFTDTHIICLVAGDSTGCGYSNWLDTCWEHVVDLTGGANISLLVPSASGVTVSCSDDSLVFQWLCQDVMGINETGSEVEMWVNSGAHSYYDSPPTVVQRGETLFVAPATVLTVNDGDTIFVRVSQVLNNLLVASADTIDTFAFIIDRSGPAVVAEGPTGVVGTPYPIARWALEDISPIDPMSPAVSVTIWRGGSPTTTSYTFPSPELSWSDDTLMFRFTTGLIGGDSVIMCIDSVADIPAMCAPNWLYDTCFSFTISQGGPMSYLLSPPENSVICNGISFIVLLCDTHGGIFTDSTRVVIGNDTIDISHYFDHLTFIETDSHCVILQITPVTPFTNGQDVNLQVLNAEDSLGNPSLGLVWHYTVDLQGPRGSSYFPPNLSAITDWHTEASARIWDELLYVDISSIEVTLLRDGVPFGSTYNIGHPAVWFDLSDSTLHFNPDSAGFLWAEFHQYCITISVNDSGQYSACMPNNSLIQWCFTVIDDDSGSPAFTLWDSCAWRALDPAIFIACSLWDTSGIFDDATDTNGQGIFLVASTTYPPNINSDWIIQMEEYPGYPGWYQTVPGGFAPYASNFTEGSFLFYQIYAYDNDFDFDTTIDRTQGISEIETCWFYNIEPPLWSAIDPQNGWFYSCKCDSQSIVIKIWDKDGLNTSSGTLQINSNYYPIFTSPQITQVSRHYNDDGYIDTLVIRFDNDPSTCWQSGDTVRVTLMGLQDIYTNTADIGNYSFIVDWEPPIVFFMNCPPSDTNIYPEQFDTIYIFLYDSISGLSSTSANIRFFVKHIRGSDTRIYGLDDNGFSYNPSTGILAIRTSVLYPDLNFAGEDSVWIIVQAGVSDNAISCGPNVTSDSLICFRYLIGETSCKARPTPFTPNADGSNDVAFFDYDKRIERDAKVYIYDMNGVLLKTITRTPDHLYIWDGTDSQNRKCHPGIYLYVVEVNGQIICSGTVVLAR